MKKILLFLLALLPAQTFAESPRQVDALIALTGDAASFGSGERNAYLLAIEEWNARGGINGQPLTLKVEDTTSTALGTIGGLKKFELSGGGRVILGPTWGDTFQAVIPVAARSGTLLLSPAAEGKALDRKANHALTMMTTYPSTELEVRTLLAEAKRNGGTKIGVLTEEDPFAHFVRTLLVEGAKAENLEVLVDVSVSGATTDFRSVITSAKQKGITSLFLLLYTERSLLGALRQRQELFPNVQVYSTHDFEGYARREEFLPYLEGAIFSTFEISDSGFVERYQKRFSEAPILTTSYAYDAANMLFSAFAAGKQTPTEVREYLLGKEHQTASFGPVRFLPEGRLSAGIIGRAAIKEGKVVRFGAQER